MLTQIRSFLVVLEEGSLNRASGRLRTSQPALSRQMQALEHEVGGRLLERTSSGVQATDVGFALADSMRRVLAGYDAGLAEARRLARGERDQLRVGYLASAAHAYLDPALGALRGTHPKLKVKLLDLSPGEQIAALRHGEIDVAVIGQEGCLAAREFYTRKLATLPILAILPAGHPLAARQQIRLEELRGERFIGAPDADMPGRNRWMTQLCRRAGFRPKFDHQAESVSQGFSLVANEAAVTLLPAYLRDYPAAGVAMVPVADPEATWDFLVVWQRARSAGPLQAFIGALSKTVDGLSG